MPNELDQKFQTGIGFKHALGVVDSDTDKSSFEETIFAGGFITSDQVLVSPIPYNNPASAITSGVVASGRIVMTPDITVGGAFRTYISPRSPVIHEKKNGNAYAPKFYYASGTLIPDGDLFAFAVFYHENGTLVIERNATTDQWVEPILIDGFFYTGLTLSEGLPAGGAGLITKAGSVAGGSFTGIPLAVTIAFATPFVDDNYSVSAISTANRSWSVDSVVSGSFVLNSNSNTLLTGQTVHWSAIHHGETSTIPVTKAGSVVGTTFSGTPQKSIVTLTTAFADTNYSISAISTANRSWTVESISTSSFVLNSNANASLSGEVVYWTAIHA